MDEPLPINFHNPQPASAGRDGFRWHVGLDEDVLLVVDLSESQAVETELGRSEIDARLPTALQRYATARLRSDLPILDQVVAWDSPITLVAEHFR